MAGKSPFHLGWLGWALGLAEERAEAMTIHDELVKRAESEYVSPLYIAWVLSGLQEADKALEWLEKAFEEKNMYLLFWRLPVFDSLSSDPRFHDLLRRFKPCG